MIPKLEYNKRNFPLCAEMPDKNPDMDLISSFLERHPDKWLDTFAAHPGITIATPEVAKDTFVGIDHLALTGPSKHDGRQTGEAYRIDSPDLVPEGSEERAAYTEQMSKVVTAKAKLQGRAGHLLNEYNWGEPADFYKDSDLQKHLTELFKAPIIRVKYSKMSPGSVINPHIDYNTTYAVRFIIPIDGNEGVENVFYDKGEKHVYNLEHGKVYFLNIGYKHAVFHNGPNVRRYLIGSLGGQQDILGLRIDK